MKRTNRCFLSLRKALKSIHLVDKCLILFMFVLIIQLIFSLFFQTSTSSEIAYIDVVVRTSTASIFGYFLSINFIHHTSTKKNADLNSAQIDENLLADEDLLKSVPSASRVQVIVATVIGLTCLIALLLLRNLAALTDDITYHPSIAATVAQFRDFVSGCVGFLIGCPTNQKKVD